jgi:hypothetical protein
VELMGQTFEYHFKETYPHVFTVRYDRMWDTSHVKFDKLNEIKYWCSNKQNVSGPYKIDFNTEHNTSVFMTASFMFNQEHDAIKFKLTWCGDGNNIF